MKYKDRLTLANNCNACMNRQITVAINDYAATSEDISLILDNWDLHVRALRKALERGHLGIKSETMPDARDAGS